MLVDRAHKAGSQPQVSGVHANVIQDKARVCTTQEGPYIVGGNIAGDPNLSAFPSADDEPIPLSFDTDPSDRRVDRVLAYLGLLDDAAPLFRSSAHVPRAGVLLALPALVDSGVFTIARKI